MDVVVVGPASTGAERRRAAALVEAGAAVVLWDPDAEAVADAVRALPRGPGRLATFVGAGDDPALAALVAEVFASSA